MQISPDVVHAAREMLVVGTTDRPNSVVRKLAASIARPSESRIKAALLAQDAVRRAPLGEPMPVIV